MSAVTVLHFTDSEHFGGAEQAILNLIAGLDRGRWRPVLAHHGAPGLAPLLRGARDLGVELCTVPPMPLGERGARLAPGFARELRTARPAVFHAHLTWPLACKYALLGAIVARVPAIVATVQLFVELPYDRAARLQQRLLAAGVHRYIAVSGDVARRLRRVFRIPMHKITVVHNAVPARGYAAAATEPPARRPGEAPVILCVARLDRQKGVCYLLEAMATVPEARLLLAGDGPERPALEARARALGLEERVVFLGYRQDVPALLAACDLFVLPSLYEGLPLSVLEAMAAGKPVIATAVGGTDEAVAHGETGVLVPPADPAALARAIRALLAAPAYAQALARAGQARVLATASVEAMAGRVARVYDETLAGGRA